MKGADARPALGGVLYMDWLGFLGGFGAVAGLCFLFFMFRLEELAKRERKRREESRPDIDFLIRITRPDGVVHSESVGTLKSIPDVWSSGGVLNLWVGDKRYCAPVGWMLEVEEIVDGS